MSESISNIDALREVFASNPLIKLFECFPSKDTCPVCRTNDEKPCILVAMDGTFEDGLVQMMPVHLSCAVVTNINKNVGVMYRRIN